MSELRFSSKSICNGERISLVNETDGKLLTTWSEFDTETNPHSGIQFDSHESAYCFYQEYAMNMGFTTSIKNSRRSKKSKEFIDAKFACSRYGFAQQDATAVVSIRHHQYARKTDCKASMHVKRGTDGKWYIHEFIREHNHELLPSLTYHFQINRNAKLTEKSSIDVLQAVSERTRKIYVQMCRQFGGHRIAHENTGHDTDVNDKSYLALDEGGAQFILEYFKHVQSGVPGFFYAVDINEEQRLRGLLWVDAKSRKDYTVFHDAVAMDTSYVRGIEKIMIPLVVFIGVNHHFQPILLGCALISSERMPALTWMLRTWRRAMGGQAPEVILTDQSEELKQSIREVLPETRHCFSLWHVFEKIDERLPHHARFVDELNECVFRSSTEEDFELKWWEIVGRFELHEDEWVGMLYEDREKWVPTFSGGVFFAGMSTVRRSDSAAATTIDRYISGRRPTVREFVRQYGAVMQSMFEEEAVADFQTRQKQPVLKSPSPWEKQVSGVYTHAVFKRFQVEVLGVVGCHLRKVRQEGSASTYEVEDCEKGERFLVVWDEVKMEVCCLCRCFEYKGYLCRHALMVLQICGITAIPPHYLLKRWMMDAADHRPLDDDNARVVRYNHLWSAAAGLVGEGSVSHERYRVASRLLMDALKSCVDANDRIDSKSCGDIRRSREPSDGKKKCSNRKRKVSPDMDDVMAIEAVEDVHDTESGSHKKEVFSGYYGSVANVQGLTQLNLMGLPPDDDDYYQIQQNIRGLTGAADASP